MRLGLVNLYPNQLSARITTTNEEDPDCVIEAQLNIRIFCLFFF